MNNAYQWYSSLKKPSWAPPSWVFSPVWFVLYILIVWSFGFVFIECSRGHIPFFLVVPFVLNLLANMLFSPLQFLLRKNFLAFLDVLVVWLSLCVCIFLIYPYYPWVAYMQIPYLLWVSFASILQGAVTYLNRSTNGQ